MAYGSGNRDASTPRWIWVATLPVLDHLDGAFAARCGLVVPEGERPRNTATGRAMALSTGRNDVTNRQPAMSRWAPPATRRTPPALDHPTGLFWACRERGHQRRRLDVPPRCGCSRSWAGRRRPRRVCADASALAWTHVEPDISSGSTRSGLPNCPPVFKPNMFLNRRAVIYARLLGKRAIAVAIKPNAGCSRGRRAGGSTRPSGRWIPWSTWCGDGSRRSRWLWACLLGQGDPGARDDEEP